MYGTGYTATYYRLQAATRRAWVGVGGLVIVLSDEQSPDVADDVPGIASQGMWSLQGCVLSLTARGKD
jgi:hypothetical protein